MVEFALQLFTLGLKRGRFEMDEQETIGLNAFVADWSCKLLKTSSENTRLMTLRCLGFLLKVPLAVWGSKLMDIANASFTLLERNAASMGEVTKASFKLITAISRDMKEFEFEDHQLKTLLHLASQDIEDPDRQGVSFGIIRTVIMRKLMVPEVYDVMERVGDLSIRGGELRLPPPPRPCTARIPGVFVACDAR